MLINNGYEQFLILFEYVCVCNKCVLNVSLFIQINNMIYKFFFLKYGFNMWLLLCI